MGDGGVGGAGAARDPVPVCVELDLVDSASGDGGGNLLPLTPRKPGFGAVFVECCEEELVGRGGRARERGARDAK